MSWNFSSMEKLFSAPENSGAFLNGKFGIEKESLRVSRDGKLSLIPHPKSLGNKNTNPYLTTDYSESQIEFITPPLESVEKSIQFLEQTHLWTYKRLGTELLWPLSMPCILPEEKDIPIAKYGNDENSQKKEIYRKGLAVRYGKKMQLISGVHYNFSLDDTTLRIISQNFLKSDLTREKKDALYFSLSRNFLRYQWLLIYLFGASPVVDDSYEPEVLKKLDQMKRKCPYLDSPIYYKKYATSLRMSKFGYSNTEQQKFPYSYNTLSKYISDIKKGLETTIPHYSQIGIFNKNKEQIQLNDNLLQLENEYYAPIRFKTEISGYSRQIDALEQKGIEYIEIRVLDIDPFSPTGVSSDQLNFMHIFLIMCLWEDKIFISPSEQKCIDYNNRIVSLRGRQTDIQIHKYNKKSKKQNISLQNWSEEIFEKLLKVACIFDANTEDNKYQNIIKNQKKKIYNTKLLPSQKIIDSMCINNTKSLIQFSIQQAKKHQLEISEIIPHKNIQKILDSAIL